MAEELTTIQLPTATRDQLKEIADFYKRSMSSQAVWMIEAEVQRVRAVKGLGYNGPDLLKQSLETVKEVSEFLGHTGVRKHQQETTDEQ